MTELDSTSLGVGSSPSGGAPDVSIVVGANGAPGSIETCLAALESQHQAAEVLVCEPSASAREVQERFPWATFLVRPDATVPELWRDGIDRCRAPIVALTISPMVPASDWVVTLRSELQHADVVAGAIDLGPSPRLQDRAEYFCRYAKDMPPFTAHDTVDLPGDNCGYRATRLEEVRDLYRDGFWEPVVNRRLSDLGAQLRQTPRLVVLQGRSAGWVTFVRQRLVHGRAHGRQRGARFTTLRNLSGVLAAPLVPGLLTVRIFREVFKRRRGRGGAILALPLILVFNSAWAIGEARGHLEALTRR